MAETRHSVDFSASMLWSWVFFFLMSNNIYVQENSLKKVYLKDANLERVGWAWFWQSFFINSLNLLCNRKHASSVCSYLAVDFFLLVTKHGYA